MSPSIPYPGGLTSILRVREPETRNSRPRHRQAQEHRIGLSDLSGGHIFWYISWYHLCVPDTTRVLAFWDCGLVDLIKPNASKGLRHWRPSLRPADAV